MRAYAIPPNPTGSPLLTAQTSASGFAGSASFDLPTDEYGAGRVMLLAIMMQSLASVTSVTSGNDPTQWTQILDQTFASRRLVIYTSRQARGSVFASFSTLADYAARAIVIFGAESLGTVGVTTVTTGAPQQVVNAPAADVEDYAIAVLGVNTPSALPAELLDHTETLSDPVTATGVGIQMGYLRDGSGTTTMGWAIDSGVSCILAAFRVNAFARETANWKTWRDATAVERTVLIEPAPAEQLTTFTFVSGSLYWSSFSTMVLTTINGGLSRELEGVEENGTPYIRCGSQSDCGATPGSFFHDTAASRIYLRTTTGSAPSTFAAITAVFSIGLASRPVDFVGGRYYEPRLTGALPELRAQAIDLLFGVQTYPGGECEIQNSDGLFDTLSVTWLWRNRKVRVYIGGSTLARADWLLHSQLAIEDFQAGRTTALMKLRSGADALQQFVPRRTVAQAYGGVTNIDGANAQYSPILIGAVRDIAPIQYFHDAAVGIASFWVGDQDWAPEVTAVYAVNQASGERHSLSADTEWVFSQGSGITVQPAALEFLTGDFQIRCDAVGTAYNGVDTRFGSLMLLFMQLAGVPADDIDREAFETANTYSPNMAWWQAERIQIADLSRIFERSSLGSLFVGPKGRWAARVWMPSVPYRARLITLDESNMTTLPVPEPAPSTPFFEVRTRYAYQPASDAWLEASKSDLAVKGKYKSAESYSLATALECPSAAAAIAQRYHYIQNAQAKAHRFTENGFITIGFGPFDRLQVTLTRAPSASGSWTEELHEAIEITKSLNPPAVELVISNVHGAALGTKVAAPVFASSGADNLYSTASATSKATYIYACDNATERADAGDASSFAQNRAW